MTFCWTFLTPFATMFCWAWTIPTNHAVFLPRPIPYLSVELVVAMVHVKMERIASVRVRFSIASPIWCLPNLINLTELPFSKAFA